MASFTPALLQEWNRALMKDLMEDPGTYRTRWAKPAQEDYIYLIPQKIPTELSRLCDYVRESMPTHRTPLERIKLAATFMTNFLHIHPFRNGNGRVARIAVSWLLMGVSIVPTPLYCGIASREDFLNCLRASRLRAPFIPSALARMILEGVVQVDRNACVCLEL
ncbi:fido domain-containing protein [Phlyctochytrium arcticum]|nr:fido domain-containing protein [Phlyctochytrium arcticum]